MLRAEVAMLQLTVAEAIGMGPRGREYGLIQAAAAASDDEGAGAAPRCRPSLVWGTHGSTVIHVYEAGCSGIRGHQVSGTLPSSRVPHMGLLRGILRYWSGSPGRCCARRARPALRCWRTSLKEPTEQVWGACTRAIRGARRAQRRLRVRLGAVGRRVRVAAGRQRRRVGLRWRAVRRRRAGEHHWGGGG